MPFSFILTLFAAKANYLKNWPNSVRECANIVPTDTYAFCRTVPFADER